MGFSYNEPDHPVAYCKYHKWRMSARQIRAKGCLHKETSASRCPHLEPYKQHQFWVGREQLKKKRLDRKSLQTR